MPFAEGESIPFGIGGQGAAMVYVRLHADGPDVPACFGQQTDVLDADGRVFAQLHSPLNMRPYPDGGFVSGPLYMPFDARPSSSTVVLRTVAYGVTYEMTFAATRREPVHHWGRCRR